jgi:hypothetical protein
LKRTWRWEEDIGAHAAPLDLSSIEKMLMVCTVKPNISADAHAMQVISTAIREYYFHGKEVFEQRRRMLIETVEALDLEPYVSSSTFPTWEQLCADFAYRSRNIKV